MEFIGKIIVDNLIAFGIGAIIIAPIAGYLGKLAYNYVKEQKDNLYKQIELINNPEIRQLVEDIILGVEQAIGSEAGEKKFQEAKAKILAKIPDIADPIVDKVLQGVFDSLKEQKKV